MRKLRLTDAFFLINESRPTPMHVGGLNLYTLPEDADEQTFLAELSETLRHAGPLRHPFGEHLRTSPLGPLGPVYWEEETQMDMEYHVRHSALPRPGRYRELFALVSRFHSSLLDRSRPLWEMHLIEGLQNRQFGCYFKVHHCAMDGMGAMHLTNSMLSPDPAHRLTHSPFSREAHEIYCRQLAQLRAQRAAPEAAELRAVGDVIAAQIGSTRNVARAVGRYASAWLGRDAALTVPWKDVPRTDFNCRISGARRFVAQSWSFERVRSVGKALGGTLNDTVLAMCSGALREHLKRQGGIPDKPLKAMAPVSVRAEGDTDSANAIGFITADLATHIEDPAARFATIRASMAAGKALLRGMSQREVEVYTLITQGPMLIATLLGLASRFPAFSVVISNVPGPRTPMYWNGARLDGMYPVSIPFHGIGLNLTLVSNHDRLDFGITACRRSVPQVQRLIDYLELALVELEAVAGMRDAPAPRKTKRPKRPARPPAQVKVARPPAKTRARTTRPKLRARDS